MNPNPKGTKVEALELKTEREDKITLTPVGDVIYLRVATSLGVSPSPCLLSLREAEAIQKLLSTACAKLRGWKAKAL